MRCSTTTAARRELAGPQRAQARRPQRLPAEPLLACGRPRLDRRRARSYAAATRPHSSSLTRTWAVPCGRAGTARTRTWGSTTRSSPAGCLAAPPCQTDCHARTRALPPTCWAACCGRRGARQLAHASRRAADFGRALVRCAAWKQARTPGVRVAKATPAPGCVAQEPLRRSGRGAQRTRLRRVVCNVSGMAHGCGAARCHSGERRWHLSATQTRACGRSVQ